MAATVSERLNQLEARLEQVEASLDVLRGQRPGVTLAEARARAHTPAERGPDTVASLRRIVGRFDGPKDLAERFRDWRNSDHG